MRNVVITLCLIGSLMIILSSFQAGEAILMFLLGGVIPGTNIILTPTETLVIIGLVTGFGISRITVPAFTHAFSRKA